MNQSELEKRLKLLEEGIARNYGNIEDLKPEPQDATSHDWVRQQAQAAVEQYKKRRESAPAHVQSALKYVRQVRVARWPFICEKIFFPQEWALTTGVAVLSVASFLLLFSPVLYRLTNFFEPLKTQASKLSEKTRPPTLLHSQKNQGQSGDNDVTAELKGPLSDLTQTLIAEGQLDKAVVLDAEYLKKAPDNNQLRYLYGKTATLAGKYDVAVEQFQHLVNASPLSSQLYMALGNVYRLKGDYGNALATLHKGAALAPEDPAPLIAEAEVLTTQGNPLQALQKYRAALRLTPDNPTLLNNVAYLLANTGGSLDEARKDVRRAIQLDSNQPRYRDTLGWIYFKQNLNDSALYVFRTLTASNPDNATFHYHLALVLLRKGDKTAAKIELQNALLKKPSADVRHDAEVELSAISMERWN